MTKALVINSITTGTDKNNQEFKMIEFQAVTFIGTREIKGEVRKHIVYPNRTVAGQEIKGYANYYNVQVGDFVEGSIQRMETTGYKIGENTVNHITVVVFAGENPVTVANSNLKRYQASVLVDGKPSKIYNTYEAAVKVVAEQEVAEQEVAETADAVEQPF